MNTIDRDWIDPATGKNPMNHSFKTLRKLGALPSQAAKPTLLAMLALPFLVGALLGGFGMLLCGLVRHRLLAAVLVLGVVSATGCATTREQAALIYDKLVNLREISQPVDGATAKQQAQWSRSWDGVLADVAEIATPTK